MSSVSGSSTPRAAGRDRSLGRPRNDRCARRLRGLGERHRHRAPRGRQHRGGCHARHRLREARTSQAVAPSPTRAEQADRLALPGWLPAESEALGEWVLRASGGFSSRGNSVFALGDPGVDLDEAAARVAQWYRARSLPPRAHVRPEGRVAAAFEEAGWSTFEPTLLMLAPVSRVLRSLGTRSTVQVRHDVAVDAGWLATDARAASFGEAARSVLEAGEVTFVTVRDGGTVLARGRGAFHGDWVGVSCLWTREDLRGTGLEQRRVEVTALVGRRARGHDDVPAGRRLEPRRRRSTRPAAMRCTTATTTWCSTGSSGLGRLRQRSSGSGAEKACCTSRRRSTRRRSAPG